MWEGESREEGGEEEGGGGFFFQAEDGKRDSPGTGVQTCALPIFASAPPPPKKAKGEEREREKKIPGPGAGPLGSAPPRGCVRAGNP